MMTPVNVHIKLLDPELPAPAYAKPGDAGADLRSRIDFELEPGERALVPTGVAIALPEGYVGSVAVCWTRPRWFNECSRCRWCVINPDGMPGIVHHWHPICLILGRLWTV